MKRLYQWVDYPGRPSREGRHRNKSKFWNEGRWHNFIEPLIPKEALEFPFLEIGCNAGLYLKMAEDMGFRHVIGIDSDADRIEQAKQYREANGGNYKLINKFVDSNFDWNELPRFGLVLLSNTHYYFPIVDFAEMIATLRDRSLYCIVVGSKMNKGRGYVSPRHWRMKANFEDWTEVKTREKVSGRNDPSPRKGMYGILFKSNLETLNLDNFYEDPGVLGIEKNPMLIVEDFYKSLSKDINLDLRTTQLYHFYKNVNRTKDPYGAVVRKKELFLDIKENGIKKLVYLNTGIFEDGLHRCMIARELGYNNILIRNLKLPKKI